MTAATTITTNLKLDTTFDPSNSAFNTSPSPSLSSTTATTFSPISPLSLTSTTSSTTSSLAFCSSPPKLRTTTIGYTHLPPSPHPSLSLTTAFSSSRAPHILHADYEGTCLLALTPSIVFKFAPTYSILTAEEAEAQGLQLTWELGEIPDEPKVLSNVRRREQARYASIERNVRRNVEWEGRVLNLLMGDTRSKAEDVCPWVIQPHLTVSSGILFPRMKESVQDVIDRARSSPSSSSSIPRSLAYRWTRQIAHALSYLEARGYYHGDLKPSNLLLDSHHNAILSDFGSAGPLGTYLRTSSNLYTTGWGKGGAGSESYAFGWTVWDIWNGGHDARLDEMDEGAEEEVAFPTGKEIEGVMGKGMARVVARCWKREWGSVRELKEAVDGVYEAGQTVEGRTEDERDEAAARAEKPAERCEVLRQEMRSVCVELGIEKGCRKMDVAKRNRSDSAIGMMECGYDSD